MWKSSFQAVNDGDKLLITKLRFIGQKVTVSWFQRSTRQCESVIQETECRRSGLLPLASLKTDRHEHTRSLFTTRSYCRMHPETGKPNGQTSNAHKGYVCVWILLFALKDINQEHEVLKHQWDYRRYYLLCKGAGSCDILLAARITSSMLTLSPNSISLCSRRIPCGRTTTVSPIGSTIYTIIQLTEVLPAVLVQ